MTRPADTYSLVADVGGTNTRVALASGPRLMTQTVRRFRNSEFASLEDVLTAFVAAEGGIDCAAASVAIAGPVRDGRGTLTNLDWQIDEDTLARATRAETLAVLNDLEAQGHALGLIDDANLTQIVSPADAPDAATTRLVLGLGTGVNVAPVYDTPTGRVVSPAEHGHTAMPITCPDDAAIHAFLSGGGIFPDIEETLSGRGIRHLHAWASGAAGPSDGASSADVVAALDDPQSLSGAPEASEAYARILGTVAGDLVLTFLPFGGLYLAGGMARAFAPHLDRLGFRRAFRNKGRFSDFMDQFPVTVIEDDFAALAGSAAHLSRLQGST